MALTRRSMIAAAATVILAAAGLWTLLPKEDGLPVGGAVAGFVPTEGRPPAPEISFSDAAGNSLSLEDFRGRTVLVNLWATWCAPCVEEMPALDRLDASIDDIPFEVVAISLDRGGAATVEPFLAEIGVEGLALYFDESGRTLGAVAARGLPTSILVDPQGREVGRLEGAAEWDRPEARALIEAASG